MASASANWNGQRICHAPCSPRTPAFRVGPRHLRWPSSSLQLLPLPHSRGPARRRPQLGYTHASARMLPVTLSGRGTARKRRYRARGPGAGQSCDDDQARWYWLRCWRVVYSEWDAISPLGSCRHFHLRWPDSTTSSRLHAGPAAGPRSWAGTGQRRSSGVPVPRPECRVLTAGWRWGGIPMGCICGPKEAWGGDGGVAWYHGVGARGWEDETVQRRQCRPAAASRPASRTPVAVNRREYA
jgi:hypothetical protein